ncbi:MAG TPA: serine protease [Candidatus Binatia bacterium]
MDAETELLVRRATPLIFGVFSQIENANGAREVRFGGSGIFVAPFQTITARHVNRDLFRVDPDAADHLQRRLNDVERGDGRFYCELPHSSALFQARLGRRPRPLIWHVRRSWDSVLTDISFMEVFAEGDEAAGAERDMAGFFEWSLLPPDRGAEVVMLGFPQADIRTNAGVLNIDLNYVIQRGEVTDIYPIQRDRGMYNFPCFRINRPVDHGFSGGPVFSEGRLCGIVSGGFDDDTYASSLWPLCLMEYEYPDLGGIGLKRSFSDLFRTGVLRSTAWAGIEPRIEKRHDENGRPYAHLIDD